MSNEKTKKTESLKSSSLKDPYYSLIARSELRESRKVGILIISLTIVSLMFIGSLYSLIQKDKYITYLSNNRIMFGFANEDGTFISSDKRPTAMIARYAKDFASNYYTFDPQSIKSNMEAARTMMDYRIALRNNEIFQSRISAVRKDTLSQIFIAQRSKVEDKGNYYLVRLRGSLEKFASSVSISRYNIEVNVKVGKVPLTEERQEGLAVIGIGDKKITNLDS